MSDELREKVQQAIAELEATYATLAHELRGCRDLANSVRGFITRIEGNEKVIIDTLARWEKMRASLQVLLDDELDAADWWKSGPADGDE